jgi:hypothetical protein
MGIAHPVLNTRYRKGMIWAGPQWGRAVRPETQRIAAMILESGEGRALRATRERSDGRRTKGNPVGGRGVSNRPRRGNQVDMRQHRPLTAIQAGEASDRRLAPEAAEKRRAAMRRTIRDNKQWVRGTAHTEPSVFRSDILPRIQELPLKVLMEATGLTKGACSRIRAGKTVPHPRHWDALTQVGGR